MNLRCKVLGHKWILQMGPMESNFSYKSSWVSTIFTYMVRMICERCKQPRRLTPIENKQLRIYHQELHKALMDSRLGKPFGEKNDPTKTPLL